MPDPEPTEPVPVELLRLRLEQSRFRADIAKWIVVALGAAASFAVIDYGRLQLEKVKMDGEAHRQVLEAYLKATETPQPEVWKRKLRILENFARDENMKAWARAERVYIERFAARDTLYRETLQVASQLVTPPGATTDAHRLQARARFEQLYWAELPYVKESAEVETAMVRFRRDLEAAEKSGNDAQAWLRLSSTLLQLSQTLRQSSDPDHAVEARPTPPA